MSALLINPTKSILERMHLDGPLLGAIVLVCMFGLVVLYSASGESSDMVSRQAIRFGLGLVAMLVMAQISPDRLLRWIPGMYALGIALLVLVAIIGIGRGSQRWLSFGPVQFQPSEIMKLAVPLMTAWYLRNRILPPGLGTVAAALIIIGLPALLIFEQPDLGTAVLVTAAGIFVLFLSGVRWRLIGIAAGIMLAVLPAVWFLMHDYQRQRVLTMLDPQADPLGAGYHSIQSVIAIGSGATYGKGWLNGTQSHLEFLPERHTDFIFAVYCEEFGFVGVVVLLLAYMLIISRAFAIAMQAQTVFGRLIAGSITMTFFIYIFVNMGMVAGVLPVVGVPLPLISYGGTSAVTLMAGFGILMSVHTHRRFNAAL
ncbi:MAG: rod shape-determining protein RodA [Gammaproteobacteria bacterium]|nr:rod shape-determining protein RodA [Gammaproteobacteria bacterium]